MNKRFWVCILLMLVMVIAILAVQAYADAATAPSAADFALQAQPAAQVIVEGQSTAYTITLAACSCFTEAVQLTVGNVPTGTAASFTANPITPTMSSTLAVTTTAATPLGDYTLIITGTSSSLTRTTHVALSVLSSAPNFGLIVTPQATRVYTGQQAVYTATIAALNSFSQPVSLSVGGLPAGATSVFSPNPVTPTGQSALVVTTAITTPLGDYPLIITGTGAGLTHTVLVTLTVSARPKIHLPLVMQNYCSLRATFAFSPTDIIAGAPVAFTDQSTCNPTAWDWDFGDGSGHASAQHPTHTYATTGTFTVTLTVSNSLETDIAIQQVQVKPPPLQAAFTFTPTDVAVGAPVTFTDQSTGGPTAWDWDFGDGSLYATQQHPTHTYTTTGAFTVTLTISNSLETDIAIQQVQVMPPLQAAFTFTPTDIIVDTPVAFTDQSAGNPIAWDWDFGDGSLPDPLQHPTHTYTSTGTFTVTLTVSNSLGIDTTAKQIYVRPAGTELLLNGSFEQDTAWEFPNTPVPAGYATTVAHSGQRSARLGIVPPAADAYSYSSTYQRVTIPAGAGQVTLSFWYWPRREGGSGVSGSRALKQEVTGRSLKAWQATLAQDTQYAMILDHNKNILQTLMAVTEDAGEWQWVTFDLTAHKGRTIYIYFDVYNNGSASEGQRAWMYVDDVSVVVTEGTPSGVHWIDVDLSEQRLYAYEGQTPVRSTLVSTGLSIYPTPKGQFYVYAKYLYDDMAGPGYYLPDVPYTMYFYLGYAIHGTYWHDNFGQPMSHGCINLPTSEAQWLYNWSPMGILVNIHE